MNHFPAYVQLAANHYRERFGLNFEQFEVGQRFRHRPGYTFSQQDNSDEALDTQNQAMLHFDNQYASQTEFGKPLMVTSLMLQKLLGMGWKTFYRRKRILGWREVAMKLPVFGGDTLYAESSIVALKADSGDPEAGLVTVNCDSYNQNKQLTCQFIYDCLIYKEAFLPFDDNNY